MVNSNILYIKNPLGGGQLEIRFDEAFLDHHYINNPTHWWNIYTAVYVLKNPKRIFEGLQREVTNDGWCFSGKPKVWHIKESKTAPFPEDKVFLVYLNNRRTVFSFYAEPEDPEDHLSPLGWKDRFEKIIWKSTS